MTPEKDKFIVELTQVEASYLASTLPRAHSLQSHLEDAKRSRNIKPPMLDYHPYQTKTKVEKILPSQDQRFESKQGSNAELNSFSTERRQPILSIKIEDVSLNSNRKRRKLQQYSGPELQTKRKKYAEENINTANFKQFQQSVTLKPSLAVCLQILKKIKCHKSSWPFRLPVNPVSQGVPDYPKVITEPMDLKTMEKKLKSGAYQHESQFHWDMGKIFMNSYKFNRKESAVYMHTLQLENYYNGLLKESKEKPCDRPEFPKRRPSDDFSPNKDSKDKKPEQAKKKAVFPASSVQDVPNQEKAEAQPQVVANARPVKPRKRLYNWQKVQLLNGQKMENFIKHFCQEIEPNKFEFDTKTLSDEKLEQLEDYLQINLRAANPSLK